MDNYTECWILLIIGIIWVLKELVNHMKFQAKIDERDRKISEALDRHFEAQEKRKMEQNQKEDK